MASASFKVKPLVLAVSSIISMLPAAQAVPVPTSIVISDTNTTGLSLNSATYDSLSSVSITDTGAIETSAYYGIVNNTTIGILSNAGTISAYHGIFNTSSIGDIVNSGDIKAVDVAIWGVGGEIGNISNTGKISGGVGVAVQSGSTLGLLNNEGTIDANYVGIYISGGGAVSALTNSGVINTNGDAIYNSQGTLDSITNSGAIQGNITSSSGLTLKGGSDVTFGTLTGYQNSGQGYIYISNGDLVFASGNTYLNDNIKVINGAVLNQASVLQINNIVNISGDYKQKSDASLLIGIADNALATGDINTDSGYGRLVVDGVANIASGSSVSLVKLGTYGFAQGQRYVVVQANTGSQYNASDLNYSASGYTGVLKGEQVADSVNGAQTDLVITLAAPENNSGGSTGGNTGGSTGENTGGHTGGDTGGNTGGNTGGGDTGGSTDPISHATTSNARSAFSGLFNYPGTRADLLNLFNASAALGNSAEANRAGAQLSPAGVAGASVKASEAPTNAVLNVISQRSDVVRAAPTSGVATGEGDSGIAMWGRGFGGVASLDDSADASGYDARFGGLLIGADSAVSDQLRLGGVVSYAGTAVDSTGDNSGSKVNIKSYGVFGYASFDAQPWYVDFSTGVVRHQYDSTRHIDFTGFSGDATGSFNGTQYIVSGQTGYPFQLGSSATTLTPIAGLTYSVLHQDGYSEDGGNGAGLTVDGATSTSLKSDLALKLEHSFKTPVGDVVPFAQAGWRHEFHDDALQSLASFSADATGSTSFVSTGAKPVRDTALFSVGTSLVSSDSLSLSVAYTGEAAGNYDSHSGNLLVRWQF